MTLLGLKKLSICIGKWKKGGLLQPTKKWSNYLLFKSYVNNTPVKAAIYSRFTAQHTSIPTGIW